MATGDGIPMGTTPTAGFLRLFTAGFVAGVTDQDVSSGKGGVDTLWPSHGVSGFISLPFQAEVGVTVAGSGMFTSPISGTRLSTVTRFRSTVCSDPNRHEVGVRPGVGWLWEGLDCKPPVVGNVGHFQIWLFCCPMERLMGWKGYWGTSIFGNFGFDIYSGFFGLFWAEMVGFVGLFWALLRLYAIGVMLLRPLVWLKLGQSSSEESVSGGFFFFFG